MLKRILLYPVLFTILLEGCDSLSHEEPSAPSARVISAANAGNANEQAHLGWMYHSGHDVPQSDTQAFQWWQKAAAAGNAYAQLALGIAYETGKGVQRDNGQAAFWYRKAADQGDADAQLNLGLAYYAGRGVPRDYEQAALWYRKAADQGNAAAEDNLGFAYAIGQGVSQDDPTAVVWYRKAADQGNAYAQYDLSAIYDETSDVPADYAKGYLQRSLNWATVKRIHRTKVDFEQAYFWVDLALAGKLDDDAEKSAETMRGSVEKRLTTEKLSAVQSRAVLWHDHHNAK